MNPTDLFKAGKLQEAIDAQIQEVKTTPGDHAKRLFLFELLAFAGDLDRAKRQADAIQYGDLKLDAGVLNYRKLLDAEQQRRDVIRGGVQPKFLSEAPEHVKLRVEALRLLREKKPAEAAKVLEQAAAVAPPIKGKLNDKDFTELRDADDLFGTVLEVMAKGNYFWVPLEHVESIALNPPRFPRDLLWVPANLEMQQNFGEVYLPALYPFSHEHADPQVKLGRSTDWIQVDGGPVFGAGLRMFLVGEVDSSLLDWRELAIE